MRICNFDLYHCEPLSVTLTQAGRLNGQRRAKPVGLIFARGSQAIKTKLAVVLEQFMLNRLKQVYSEACVIKKDICCFTDCIKTFNTGMHSDVYRPIRLKHGMIDTPQYWSLILVCVTLTLI